MEAQPSSADVAVGEESIAPDPQALEREAAAQSVAGRQSVNDDTVPDGDRLQSLFNGFLGKLQAGDIMEAERYASRQAASGLALPLQIGDETHAASLNRLVEAMAAFESSGDGLGVKVSGRDHYLEQFRDLAAY